MPSGPTYHPTVGAGFEPARARGRQEENRISASDSETDGIGCVPDDKKLTAESEGLKGPKRAKSGGDSRSGLKGSPTVC